MKPDKYSKWLLLFLMAGFVFVLVRLFVLRFESGDLYPPYSSFRADPLGTRVLFDAMSKVNPSGVSRNYKPAGQVKELEDTCILLAGLQVRGTFRISRKSFDDIIHLVTSGNRLVIALVPSGGSGKKEASAVSRKEDQGEDENLREDEDSGTTDPDEDFVDFMEQLGLELRTGKPPTPYQQAVTDQSEIDGYPMAPILWLRNVYFDIVGQEWRTIYAIPDSDNMSRPHEAVVIERRFGNGSMVLMTDAYALSNECLRERPNAGFLVWLTGGHSKIMFDEYHLGVQKQEGISDLFIRYHLYGPLAFLLVLAALFFRRSGMSLVPPDETDELLQMEAENTRKLLTKDHSSGLTSLLEQHVPKKKLILQCLQVWKNTFVADNEASRRYRDQYETIKNRIDFRQKNRRFGTGEVEDYKEICRILAEKEKV